jgi:hypothetical protein
MYEVEKKVCDEEERGDAKKKGILIFLCVQVPTFFEELTIRLNGLLPLND